MFYSFCSILFAGNIYRGGATTFLKYQEEVVYTDSFSELPQGLTKAKPTKSSKKRKRIVEGGTKTIQKFIDANLWDEARVITNNQPLRSGIKAPYIIGLPYASNKIKDDEITYVYRIDDNTNNV